MMGNRERVNIMIDAECAFVEFYDDGDVIIQDLEGDEVSLTEHSAFAVARAIIAFFQKDQPK